jgi:hypothetical protein
VCVKLCVAIATTVYHSDSYKDNFVLGLINTISVRGRLILRCLEVGHSDLRSGQKLYGMTLKGKRFQLITDHIALLHFSTLKDTTGQLTEILLNLQKYDLEISHKSGSQLIPADPLSRIQIKPEKPKVIMFDAQTQTPIPAMRETRATNAQHNGKTIIATHDAHTKHREDYMMPGSLEQTPKQHVQDNLISDEPPNSCNIETNHQGNHLDRIQLSKTDTTHRSHNDHVSKNNPNYNQELQERQQYPVLFQETATQTMQGDGKRHTPWEQQFATHQDLRESLIGKTETLATVCKNQYLQLPDPPSYEHALRQRCSLQVKDNGDVQPLYASLPTLFPDNNTAKFDY